jgi:hypothetical protein
MRSLGVLKLCKTEHKNQLLLSWQDGSSKGENNKDLYLDIFLLVLF